MSYNANSHLTSFHNARVFVDDDGLKQSRERRKANRDRLTKGLEKNEEPQPETFVPQGSYAMHTMVQSDIEHSDIDDGVVFTRAALKGPRQGDRSPYDARCMVRDAINVDDAFKTKPEVRKNCVRVFYADGFHVDLPVYREYAENGQDKKELASGAEWKASKPEDITEWFNNAVTDKSPDSTNGRQMRRAVRLLKAWAKSRATWSMPSGFIITVLVDEAYPTKPTAWLDRDDLALLQLMRSIRNRLLFSGCRVYRPVTPKEEITSDATIGRVGVMRDELKNAIDSLAVIERADCDELMALQALKAVFNTDYFDQRIKELKDGGGNGGGGNGGGKAAAIVATPAAAVIKKGGTGQYGRSPAAR